VKKLGSFFLCHRVAQRTTEINKGKGKSVESAEPMAEMSRSLTHKGIRDDLSRQVGFVWVEIGFRGIFGVHFRSLIGFRLALSILFLGYIGFRLYFLIIFWLILSGSCVCFCHRVHREHRGIVKIDKIQNYISKNHRGRKTAHHNYPRVAYLCRKLGIFWGRKSRKSLRDKDLKIF